MTLDGNALIEAWKIADETSVYVPPSYPPPADERAETHRYLPAVPEFFGTRCCHPANTQLPPTAQHAATLAYEALERTLDLRPQSGVRAAAPRTSSADTQAVHAPSARGGAETSVDGQGVSRGAR